MVNVVQQGINRISFDDSEVQPICVEQGMINNPDLPLVVQLDIANFGVRKVLVDNGSSANIIFADTLNKMDLKPEGLRNVTMSPRNYNLWLLTVRLTIQYSWADLESMPSRRSHQHYI